MKNKPEGCTRLVSLTFLEPGPEGDGLRMVAAAEFPVYAAAPELFEVLNALLGAMTVNPGGSCTLPAAAFGLIGQARAAVLKATSK